jgi:hypothetical protein
MSLHRPLLYFLFAPLAFVAWVSKQRFQIAEAAGWTK